MLTSPNLLPDAFAGTATAYARYRPPYPNALLSDLLVRAGVAGESCLLDLACGPGRVALDLAASFATVWAIDLEPEMIEVGMTGAALRGADNITWFVGRAEELIAPARKFDLITIGDAFHRLDQNLIAEKAMAWLKPGGYFATLGTNGILGGSEVWQTVVADIAQRWWAKTYPDGWATAHPGAAVGQENIERVLHDAGFMDVASRTFSEPRDWTFEEIVGFLQSTSVCSRRALGGNFEAFDADLKAALLAESASLRFHENLKCGYTLARKPQ